MFNFVRRKQWLKDFQSKYVMSCMWPVPTAVSSRSRLWSFPDGKCQKASSAQLLSHWNVCGQPAQLGVGLISNVTVKLKRNGRLRLAPCLSLSLSLLWSFIFSSWCISEVSRLSSCRFFKSCKLCVSYHISKCSVFITDFVRGCLCPPCHCYTLGSSCGTCTEE